MEDDNLHLLINEEIYVISGDEQKNVSLVKPEQITEETDKISEKTVSVNPESSNESDDSETSEHQDSHEDTKLAKAEISEDHTTDSPTIPDQQEAKNKEIHFAIFHSSTNNSDIELLNKIIAACKLPENSYQIFAGGFDQTILFKKALVFVPEAKAFYTPIPYKGSEFLCSKPLDKISGDVQEKTKLWNALQKFVDSLQS